MSKNYDIKTASDHVIGSTCSSVWRANIGSSVAAGMTRYVTFIRVVPVTTSNAKGSKIFFCSTASAATVVTATAASAVQKMVVFIGSATAEINPNRSESIPAVPNTEHPLFTIAAEQWLTALIATTAGMSGPANIFVQYFDE